MTGSTPLLSFLLNDPLSFTGGLLSLDCGKFVHFGFVRCSILIGERKSKTGKR